MIRLSSPRVRNILLCALLVGSNWFSYDLGYTDGVRDIIHGIRELQDELRRGGNIDPAVKGVEV